MIKSERLKKRHVALFIPLVLLAIPEGLLAQNMWRPTFEVVQPGNWTGPRLADGQPDIQGHWSNTIGNQDNFTDPRGGIPGDPSGAGGGGAAAIGTNVPVVERSQRAPSRVSDPADGEVPFQPWARALQQEFLENFFHPTEEQYIEPLARCAPGGPIKSLYWHGYEIRQYPGYIVFMFNSSTRVIHLSDAPHLPDTVKLWNGDSRAHWEGNTLVVDVRNNNAKARLARTGEFHGPNAHITERYVFANDGSAYTYHATITDPEVFTQPWTVTIPAVRYTEGSQLSGWHYPAFAAVHDGEELIHEVWERTCAENNGNHGKVSVQ